MSVLLEAIEFNHKPSSATTDALSIRKNLTQTVPVPEWSRDVSADANDSLAAYAIRETRGNPITIRARFTCTDPAISTVEVRALDRQRTQVDLPLWVWQLPYYIWRYYGYWNALAYFNMLVAWSAGSAGNILGEIHSTQLAFEAGESRFETFGLDNHRLESSGVGVHQVVWEWQYRLGPGDAWKSMTTTRHQIYTVLETPKGPWLQVPNRSDNTQMPWADVLDYACRWAAGAQTLDDAAAKVTRAVYELGPEVVRYGCETGGSSLYTDLLYPVFDCAGFLDRLRGTDDRPPLVNCTDCATVVSTFANILGCDLWQARMGNGRLYSLNPILAIGSGTWQSACGWPGFGMHEVAWKWPCTEDEEVFDACLLVDADPHPGQVPHVPRLPVHVRFGRPGEGQYRDHLCTPAGSLNCVPQARLGAFRPVQRVVTGRVPSPLTFGFAVADIEEAVPEGPVARNLKERFAYDEWVGRNTVGENLFIWQFRLPDEQIGGWRQRHVEETEAPSRQVAVNAVPAMDVAWRDWPRAIRSIWQPSRGKTDRLIRETVYECASQAAAQELLLRLLGQFESPLISRREKSPIGDVAFSDPDDRVIVFARANLVCVVQSAGSRSVPVADKAGEIDRDLIARPEVAQETPLVEITSMAQLDIAGARQAVSMDAVASRTADRPAMVKFFSRNGRVMIENGQLVYQPDEGEEQELEMYEVAPDRGPARRTVRFDVK